MAKKQKLSRIIIAGAGLGVLIAVIFPVMFFVFGVGNNNIHPQSTSNALEIPFTNEDIKKNEQIVNDINNIICPDGSKGTQENPCVTTDDPFTVQKKIDEKELEVIDPSLITNQTTSEDPPITQTCDQDPENILCQVITPSTSLKLKSKVTKIDSSGLSTIEEKTFDIPSLAFLVEEQTNRDFRKGFLILELQIIADPNTKLDATGEFDVLINGRSILTQPVSVKEVGITDSSGGLRLSFLSPTGQPSPDFSFSFDKSFTLFENEKINIIELKINKLDITKEDVDKYSLVDQTLFDIDITRNDQQLIITDEQGGTLRVYPTDSKIILTTSANNIYGTTCLLRTYGYVGLTGNPSGNKPSDCYSSINNKVLAGIAPAPSVTGIILLDADGKLLTTKAGGTGQIFNELVTRNANYTLKTSSPDLTSKLSFGKSQETKSYTCISTGTVKYTTTTTVTGLDTTMCGRSYNQCSYYIYLKTNGFTLGATQCNFPK